MCFLHKRVILYKKFSVIILAAGKSSRMLSDVPKVMHKIAGKPMLQHLIDTTLKMQGVQSIYIVCAKDNFDIMQKVFNVEEVSTVSIHWVLQQELLGTGHAIQQALSMINDDNEEIFVLYGDVPLVSSGTLKKLYCMKSQCDLGLLTATLTNPIGYGRIIRDQEGNIVNIIEDHDIVTDEYKKIEEVYTGILISVVKYLKFWIEDLSMHSAKNEFYLTDVVSVAYRRGYVICSVQPVHLFEIIGINSKSDLVELDRMYQKEQAKYLLSIGVIIYDPDRFDLRGTLICGRDVHIDINVIIEGHVSLGNRVSIGASCILKDAVIEDDVVIFPFSIIENATIHCCSKVGPLARLRNDVELQENSRVGNFVELKSTVLGNASKVKHLSYVGDAEIGSQVNIGAGTIFCNYDGVKKNRTNVKDNVFIGSNSQLVAPITIEKNAIIGAGTTVTKNVAENDIVISRIRQFSIIKKKRLKK